MKKLEYGQFYAVRRLPWWRAISVSFMPWAVVVEAADGRHVSQRSRLNDEELARRLAADLNTEERP